MGAWAGKARHALLPYLPCFDDLLCLLIIKTAPESWIGRFACLHLEFQAPES